MQLENTQPNETVAEEAANIEHLGELLHDEDVKEKDAGASGESSGSEKGKPTKFNDLAERLELELSDLYSLEVSQSDDGTPVTIEQLKDHYAKQGDLSLREIEFEERKVAKEAEIMQAHEELNEIMSALPERAIKPEVLAKVREKLEAQQQLERSRMLEVIPEWRQDVVRTRELEGMVDHLKQYGYPTNYLERVDHRQMKYIRDNWQREQRIRKALERVKAGNPSPTTKHKASKKAPSKRPLAGVKMGNARNKMEAVFSQLY